MDLSDQKVIIFVGLQASGKTSFYRSHLGSCSHVSRDNFRNNRNPTRRQQQLIAEALRAGQSVVVDNTNPAPEDRRSIIELGKSLGTEVVGCYFPAGLKDCLKRNLDRQGPERIPKVGLYSTAKRLTKPSLGEGFDRLYEVTICPEGGFLVQNFQDSNSEGDAGRVR